MKNHTDQGDQHISDNSNLSSNLKLVILEVYNRKFRVKAAAEILTETDYLGDDDDTKNPIRSRYFNECTLLPNEQLAGIILTKALSEGPCDRTGNYYLNRSRSLFIDPMEIHKKIITDVVKMILMSTTDLNFANAEALMRTSSLPDMELFITGASALEFNTPDEIKIQIDTSSRACTVEINGIDVSEKNPVTNKYLDDILVFSMNYMRNIQKISKEAPSLSL